MSLAHGWEYGWGWGWCGRTRRGIACRGPAGWGRIARGGAAGWIRPWDGGTSSGLCRHRRVPTPWTAILTSRHYEYKIHTWLLFFHKQTPSRGYWGRNRRSNFLMFTLVGSWEVPNTSWIALILGKDQIMFQNFCIKFSWAYCQNKVRINWL